MTAARVARARAPSPQARAVTPRPTPPSPWLRAPPYPAPRSGKGPGQAPDVCAGLGRWLRSPAPGSGCGGGGGGGRGARRTGAPPGAWGAEPRRAEAARARGGHRGPLGTSPRVSRRKMGSAEDAVKEKLLRNVKKEVKSGHGPPGARVPLLTAHGTGRSVPIPGRGRTRAWDGGRSWPGCGSRPTPGSGAAPLGPGGWASASGFVCSATPQLPALRLQQLWETEVGWRRFLENRAAPSVPSPPGEGAGPALNR